MSNKVEIVSVRVWESRDYRYTREEYLSFGIQAEAKFNEPPTDEEFDQEVVRLYMKLRKAIKAEVKEYAERDKLFRLAKKVERPKLIRGYERILKVKGN